MGTNNTTTTWYAFQDPKTNREYFHEPISGKTSWVLPTSSSKSAQIIEGADKHNIVHFPKGNVIKAPKSETMKRQQKEVGTLPQNKQKQQSRSWGAIGITIVSILFFNTMFITVLVKALYDNGNRSNAQALDHNNSGDLPVQAHAIPSSNGDAKVLETMIQKDEIISEINSNSFLDEEPFLSDNAQLDNETQNGNDENNAAEVEEQLKLQTNNSTEESSSTISSPEVLSSKDYSLDDDTEAEDMHQSDPEVVVVVQEERASGETITQEVETEDQGYDATSQEAETAKESEDAVQMPLQAEESTREPDNHQEGKGKEEDRRDQLLQELNQLQQKRIQLQQKHQRGNDNLFVSKLRHCHTAAWHYVHNKVVSLRKNMPSWICSVPFSYKLFGTMCGHRDEKGSSMPLSDADKSLWI